MADSALVTRLEGLSSMAELPREELEWLVSHGELRSYEVGDVVGPKGKRMEWLMVLLAGHHTIRVDRGAGPKLVLEWRTGDVNGILPYSRMTGPPADVYAEEPSEVLAVHEGHFPEMTHRCPQFTAGTVHTMLDRARAFSASDLHDEKMVSLGKLAAGMAHELNNPASATVRSAKLLLESLTEADAASRTLTAAGVSADALERIEQACSVHADDPPAPALSPIELADREDELADWLADHGSDQAHAASLAGTKVTLHVLGTLAEETSGDALDAALRWVVARSTSRSLASEIGQAATRIHEVVSAVKRFTFMDHLAGPEAVDVEAGLRDTIGVLASKAKGKKATVSLTVEPNLPRVRAAGGELNQVWVSLLDNALDAIAEGGTVEVSVCSQRDRIAVSVIDDGPGIPHDIMPHIFDPFFTTKPPGQGTGLGLEMARRLVRSQLGEISAASVPGRTEFCVSLVAETAATEGA